ncbi:MAG: T9SS type A sorting domain-containing protein [Bacteroidia bacterium]|nr:T9SS type A sorting domain-containing protein [Bacteroidia bacterium]
MSPTDANKVWVVCANTSAGNKIFYSSNGGTSWTNYTSNLPNIPANCVVYEPGTSDRVYIGMDYGIYYRDNTQSTWTLYNAGLPNVPISDMEISPAMPTKLVAATYGRGVWIVDVVPTAAAPVTAFAFTGNVCRNTPKTFNDNSTNGPTSWSWSVTPSAGVTITTPTSQNPSITFANTGTYVVAMTASNVSGPGNTFTQSIVVYPTPTVTIASSVNTVCAGNPVTFTASGASSYSWACPTSSICNYSPTTSTNYVFVGTSSAGCTSSGSKSITVIPNVTVNVAASSTVYCATAQAVTLTATGASSYTWNPGNTTGTTRTVTPATNTTYTVLGTNGICSNTKTITVTAAAVPSVNATASNSVFCSGSTQPVILTGSGATSYNWNPGNLSGTSVSVSPAAATVYTVTGSNGTCSNTKTISIGIGTSPVINAASSTSLLCAGTGATLTASGATSYSWSTGATTPTISVFPTLSTTYTVTGFNGPCSATTTVVQNVSWCTGISEQALLNSYKLFPNPFSNQLTIDAEEEVEITIINSLGQIVNVYTFEKHGIINTSEFASGIYFVNMKGNSGMKSYKLIKN